MARYGLALAGGGARGAAHVGVLMALEEANMLPEQIAGTSAGSIVAGLYASGMRIDELKETVLYLQKYGTWYLDVNIKGIVSLGPQLLMKKRVGLSGLFRGNRLAAYLCQLTGNVDVKDVEFPLLIPSVDLNSGDTVSYTNLPTSIYKKEEQQERVLWEREGLLGEIIMASASVPGIFSPRILGKYRLVDGGVTNNLPVDLLIEAGASQVIAVDISSNYRAPSNDGLVEVLSSSFEIMRGVLNLCAAKGELLLLKPPLPADAGLLSFSSMQECMDIGYEYTKEQIGHIRTMLYR